MKRLVPKEFVLYSTNTELAYTIAKEYYNRTYYVWCTDSFDAMLQPGTSNPRTLCARYLEQIIKQDRHAFEINNNKVGILKGATEKLRQGIINDDQYREISTRVAYAKMEDFYPMIFLINRKAVKDRLETVDQKDAASNKSIEYVIKDLQWNEFEIVRIKNMLSGVLCPIDD